MHLSVNAAGHWTLADERPESASVNLPNESEHTHGECKKNRICLPRAVHNVPNNGRSQKIRMEMCKETKGQFLVIELFLNGFFEFFFEVVCVVCASVRFRYQLKYSVVQILIVTKMCC